MGYNIEPPITPESDLGIALGNLEQCEAAFLEAQQALQDAEAALRASRSQASEAMSTFFVGRNVTVSASADEELIYDTTDGWLNVKSGTYFRGQSGIVTNAGVSESHHSKSVIPRLWIDITKPSGHKSKARFSLARLGSLVLEDPSDT